MKEYTNPTWQCEHCGRLFSHKANAARHEAVCRKSPDIKKLCYSCKHFENGDYETKPIEVWHEALPVHSYHSYSVTKNVQQNRCKAMGCMLYNPFHTEEDFRDALEESGYKPMLTINQGCEKYERYDS